MLTNNAVNRNGDSWRFDMDTCFPPSGYGGRYLGRAMTGYNCYSCKLALEIGQTVPWDLTGFYHQFACKACGTIHQIRLLKSTPDLLLAQPAPIIHDIARDRQSPTLMLQEWLVVSQLDINDGILPSHPELNQRHKIKFDAITCNHCKSQGMMCTSDNTWPSETDECPRCSEAKIAWAYVAEG